jgi:penicillin-insensitive murein endopeptidase
VSTVRFIVAILLALDAGATPPGSADAGTPLLPPRKLGLVAQLWGALPLPAEGVPQAIGTTSCGCLQGGARLPASGMGYEALHLGRNRRYGHPALIAYVERLGAAAATLRRLVVVGDLSQPRGGPTPSGHRSHQTGLDGDIGYAPPAGARAGRLSALDRERMAPPAVVDLKTHNPTRAWSTRSVKLLALAAADPAVDRIFVNPAVKRMLCQGTTAKAPWQARVRPWWGHHDHFHVRLRCPEDSPLCVPQDPPTDDGCGATLAWWFSDDADATRTRRKEAEGVEAEPVLPEACAGVMEALALPLPLDDAHSSAKAKK